MKKTMDLQQPSPTPPASGRAPLSAGYINLLRPLIVLVVGALVLSLIWQDAYYQRIVAVIGLAVISACGLNILTGVTGQISLGHAGFYAVGAYVTALLTVKAGWSVLATIPIGLVITAVLGLVLAWPALRLKGPYLTMVTIAFGLIVHGFATDFTDITNGPEGLFPIPAITLGHFQFELKATNILLLVLVAAAVYTQAALINGRFGRAMRAVRGNELAASSLGINVVGIKCLAFAVSGVLAGLAGMLYAPVNGFVNPDAFTMDLSVLMLLMVILGGRGTVWGPVAGAIVLTLIDRVLAQLGDVRLVIYGVILLVTLHLMPDGLTAVVARVFGRRRRQAAGLGDATPVAAAGSLRLRDADRTVPPLILRDVGKSFGGLVAVDGVNMDVPPGSIHGLVGPNGAGKTTVLNLISGVITPDHGSIKFGESSVGGQSMHKVAMAGIGRTFQNLALFPEMTVLENVMAGLHMAARSSFLTSVIGTPAVLRDERRLHAEAMLLLNAVGLGGEAQRLAAVLPQGHQRLLEIARALAVGPGLLLLDEPAAGLNGAEVDRLTELIRKISATGITVLLIEHHMQLVMSVCDSVTVLDFGRMIAAGTPAEVRSNPQVLEAYLGKPAESATASGTPHDEATSGAISDAARDADRGRQ
ncbi:MAG: branched-chain amino acid ABC transporter ATP-binding protein/permease [Janthinobacterium lividum]